MVSALQQKKNLINHVLTLNFVAPSDKVPGYYYYNCSVCSNDYASVNGQVGAQIVPGTEIEGIDSIPFPRFNTFENINTGYQYSARGASLRINHQESADLQDIRFTASMQVPAGAEIIQFGYVFSQQQFITDKDNFIIGAEKVYDTQCSNYTVHSETGTDIYTFNLVIKNKFTNWDKTYVARAYVTYTYDGRTFTVYDEDYSARSTAEVARKIVESEFERTEVKEYIQAHILDRLSAV